MEIINLILTVWGISTLIVVVLLFLWGLLPVLWRFGNALVHKKIVIYAKGDNASDLNDLIREMDIFKGNIITVRSKDSVESAEKADIHLMRWCDAKVFLDKIVAKKKKNSAIIIYCPHEDGRLDDDAQKILNTYKHAVLVNFRGRLLNDIITSLVTIKYGKK